MKRAVFLAAAAAGVLALSCAGLSCTSVSAWSAVEGAGEELVLSTVRVDKAARAASIEAELVGLAPAVFSARGLRMRRPEAAKDSAGAFDGAPVVEVHAFEREWLDGWAMRRTVSFEVLILDGPSRISAGRAVASGGATLDSSVDLRRLFMLAAKRAVEARKK